MGSSDKAGHVRVCEGDQALHRLAGIFSLLDNLGDISCFAGIADLQLYVPRLESQDPLPAHGMIKGLSLLLRL